MFRASRRTAMKVRHGRVHRKNRTRCTLNYFDDEMAWLVIDRQRPGPGACHVVRREEVRRFVALLPDWSELQKGLNAIVLAKHGDCLGWHRPGVVAICAWERELGWDCEHWFYDEHREIFEKIGVHAEPTLEHVTLRFTIVTAKAFQLVHVLVHELGHHHDRITTRRKRHASRGEDYAEAYARRYEDQILKRYRQEFTL